MNRMSGEPPRRRRRRARARFESFAFTLADGTVRRRLQLAFTWKGPRDAERRRYRMSLEVDDSRQARRNEEPRRQRLEDELRLGTFNPARWFDGKLADSAIAEPTLGAFARAWLDELAGAGLASSTLAQYRVMLEAHFFKDDFAGVLLRDLNDGHLVSWRGRLQSKELGATTVNKIMVRVKTLVNVAYQRRLIPTAQSPAALVRNLRDPGRDVDPFGPEELLKIFGATLSAPQRNLYIVSAFTGARPGEICALDWTCVDFERGVIAVRNQVDDDGKITSQLKTARSRREITMLTATREALNDQRARTIFAGGGLVFANPRGGPLLPRSQGDHPWRRTLERAGVPYRPWYNMRHTFTTLCLSAQRPIQWIAHQLGHAGVRKLDEVYGRWTRPPDDKVLDLDKLAALIASDKPVRNRRAV
jgi:integrase